MMGASVIINAKRNIQEAVYELMTMELTLGAVQAALEAGITTVDLVAVPSGSSHFGIVNN